MNNDTVQFFGLVGLMITAVIVLLAVRFRAAAGTNRTEPGDEVYTQDGYFATVVKTEGRLVILAINEQGEQLSIKESGIKTIIKRNKKQKQKKDSVH